MVDRLSVQRAHPADVISIPGKVRQQLRVHHHATLTRGTELKLRRRDWETRLSAGHRSEPLAVANAFRQVFVIPLLHHRLVIKQVHLCRSANHVQIDHTLGLRRKLRALSVTTGRTGHRFTKQRCKRRATEHIFTAGEELTAGLISVPFLEESHGDADYLFSTSSRFMS